MPRSLEERSSLRIVRAVVFALVLREMQTRFGARRMGAFWMLFEPIAHVAVMMFIFGFIRGREVPGMEFPVFFATGIIPFLLIRNLTLRIMDAPNANQALFAYQQIKPFDTFIARTIVEFSLFLCVYSIVIGGLGLWLGYDVSMHDPLMWILALATGVMFSFGLGLVLCIVVEAFPNSRTFIRLTFLPLYIISGVIFPIWVLPREYLEWILWNPYLHIISNLRESVFEHYPEVYGISFTYPFSVALVMLFAGMALYRVRRLELMAR